MIKMKLQLSKNNLIYESIRLCMERWLVMILKPSATMNNPMIQPWVKLMKANKKNNSKKNLKSCNKNINRLQTGSLLVMTTK